MKNTELWVCEYSREQKAVHVDTMEKILRVNRRMVMEGEFPQFIPLQVFTTQEDAKNFASAIELMIGRGE